MRQLAEEGMTTVIATHEMTFAKGVGNRLAVIDRGEIVQEGLPKQIFDAPTTERTRDFWSHLGWSG